MSHVQGPGKPVPLALETPLAHFSLSRLGFKYFHHNKPWLCCIPTLWLLLEFLPTAVCHGGPQQPYHNLPHCTRQKQRSNQAACGYAPPLCLDIPFLCPECSVPLYSAIIFNWYALQLATNPKKTPSPKLQKAVHVSRNELSLD